MQLVVDAIVSSDRVLGQPEDLHVSLLFPWCGKLLHQWVAATVI